MNLICCQNESNMLTLIPKWLAFAIISIEPGQPTHSCSLNQALYSWLTKFKFSY